MARSYTTVTHTHQPTWRKTDQPGLRLFRGGTLESDNGQTGTYGANAYYG